MSRMESIRIGKVKVIKKPMYSDESQTIAYTITCAKKNSSMPNFKFIYESGKIFVNDMSEQCKNVKH